MKKDFWNNKKMREFTHEQWEALCDHCGTCCLHKIEDTETGNVYTTYVACKYLDIKTCMCVEYNNRQSVQPRCLYMTPDTIKNFEWLPATCAYRLVSEGKDLPDWHPLKSGNPLSPSLAQKSVAHFALPESDIDSLENYIIEE